MSLQEITISTEGERFYDITSQIQQGLISLLAKQDTQSGVLTLFCRHTSCGLAINESYDPSAARDMEEFLKHLAPRNLSLITHTTEGPDDSPSHMKSLLIHHSMSLIVDQGKLMLGTWQGIYLCEFRDHPHHRKILLKYQGD